MPGAPMAAGPAAAGPAATDAASGGGGAAPGAIKAYVPPKKEDVEGIIRTIVSELSGESDLPDADTPFMEAGIDSLAATEMRTRLQKTFHVQLQSTVMFNSPTATLMA